MIKPLFLLIPALLTGGAMPAIAVTEIDVGVVQRFGDEQGDRLTLSSGDNRPLTLSFPSPNGDRQTLTTASLTLEVRPQPQGSPVVQEWIVLSDHATFETAEDASKQWAARGIAVEVTQPGRWQVWAKRDVYSTPLLRRKLLESLREGGETDPYLQSEVLEAVPIVSFQVGNFRYNRQEIDITTPSDRIRVQTADGTTLYGGTMRIQPNAYGNFTLVNTVDIETYLRGVVPHEIGPQAPYTAVQAQTVIARTYALRNTRRFQADDYELCATVHCQVYKGLTGTVARADQAIQSTAGQVLTYEDELVDALYSAHTGGVTAQFEDIWDGQMREYLRARVDAIAPTWNLAQAPLDNETAIRQFLNQRQGFNGADSPVFRWDRSSTLPELTADLNKYLTVTKHPLGPVQQIIRMAVTERSPSGRIRTLAITTNRGVIELHKTEARSALGPPRSTLFYIDPILNAQGELSGYRFVGGGFGHGVGLNQYGSYTLSNQGWDYRRILQFYYPGTTLQPFSPNIIRYQPD